MNAMNNDSKGNNALLHVFPNPAKGAVSFDIETGSETEFILMITDLSGKVVRIFDNMRTTNKKASIRWNTESLAKGAYMVKVQTADRQVIDKKLLVE